MQPRHTARCGVPPVRRILLAIKFHNQLFVDRAVNIIASRQSGNRRRHVAAGRRNPRRPAAASRGLPGTLNVSIFATRFFDRNYVAWLHLIRRDIDLTFVNQNVTVIHELPCLPA